MIVRRRKKIRRRLHKQSDHLFVFLDYAEVDATNNLAESQLSPAVIARKLSAGNKTRAGADAWAIPASLGTTARQRALSFIDLLAVRNQFATGKPDTCLAEGV